MQDDTYTESYISTIGVDFVSGARLITAAAALAAGAAWVLSDARPCCPAENQDCGAGRQGHQAANRKWGWGAAIAVGTLACCRQPS